ncbi:hypothetical protein BCR39DRAFT_348275 [Naematelia encephala]|uniref:Uncharacterized protein n=1 Tax=Naematelia encephala TaxID=71784 RepID=A0A1Y2AM38_9TREE|nr:hypothetical protein BCR39DRAFT_348275 [Naematelia encephala]
MDDLERPSPSQLLSPTVVSVPHFLRLRHLGGKRYVGGCGWVYERSCFFASTVPVVVWCAVVSPVTMEVGFDGSVSLIMVGLSVAVNVVADGVVSLMMGEPNLRCASISTLDSFRGNDEEPKKGVRLGLGRIGIKG